jgi:predicted O-methyltransferase YrrM
MEKGVKRFSFKYIFNKLGSVVVQKSHPDWPWWPKDAVLLFNQLIKESDRVLEFGSGRSTFWVAKKCTYITSIENDQNWYNTVKEKISHANLDHKVKLIYAPIADGLNAHEQPYLLPVKDIDIDSVDLVIVDGKLRAQATFLSLPLLKSSGILIIDDAHRYIPERGTVSTFPESTEQEIWKDIDSKTKNWRSVWTSDGIHATCFLIKP